VVMRTITVERGYDRASSHSFHLAAWGLALPGRSRRSWAPVAFSFRATPRHLQRAQVLVTDAHQEPSLTRIKPVAGATAAEFERVYKHRDRAILVIATKASILTGAVMP
jgi:hypothetical protein